MSRQLKAQLIFPKRFSLEIPVADAGNAIFSALRVEVEFRRRKFVFDDETKEAVRKVAEWLVDGNGKFGLMLAGTCGNGKTTLMRSVARLIEYLSELEKGYSRKDRVMVVTAKDIAECCLSNDGRKQYMEYCQAPMLAIDDLGVEPTEVVSFGMCYTPLVDLLTRRYDQQRFTMVTTNLSIKELKEHYGERVYDRFREMMRTVVFARQSFRGEDNETAQQQQA